MKSVKKDLNGNGAARAVSVPRGGNLVTPPTLLKPRRDGEVPISSLEMVAADLRKVEDRLVQLLEKRGGALKGPAEMMFRSGGKRLRPALVLLSSRLFGNQPESALSIAAAVEMVHGASLIHDDVIDTTDIRRGLPTLNALTGNRIAVLLGDFLLCQALLAVAELDQVVLLQVVSEAVAEMTAGQIMELRQQGCVTTSVDEYLTIIEGKTAALMEAGCRLGGLLNQAQIEQLEAVGLFGRYLGMAFQITDDILDFWGDPEVMGKPTGADLREKKYTLPFLYSYQRSSEEERGRIRDLAGADALDAAGLAAILQWMNGHEAKKASLDTAASYTRKAGEALNLLPEGLTRTSLYELLDYVIARGALMDFGNYGYAAVFLLGGFGFVCFNISLASFVSRLGGSYRPSASKGLAYECGEPPIGEAWVQYNVRYYLYAMLFVLFDVEAAFLIPWAADFQTLYRAHGAIVLLEMVSFLGILGAALVYAWKKGVLEWV